MFPSAASLSSWVSPLSWMISAPRLRLRLRAIASFTTMRTSQVDSFASPRNPLIPRYASR